MRQITVLLIIVGLIIFIGCNFAFTINSPVGILCMPLSLGVAMFVIISVLERKKYYYDYTFYDDTGSLLTQRMYEKDTIGDALVGRVGATIGTGLVFFIVHSIVNITPTFTNPDMSSYTTVSLTSQTTLTNFAINAMIISAILFITAGIKYVKNIFETI